MTQFILLGLFTVLLPLSGFVQQAIAQVCAFCSPKTGSVSAMGIFHQFHVVNETSVGHARIVNRRVPSIE
jgi:hypothetical protein